MKDDKRARALALLQEGLSDREVARRVSAGHQTVGRWRREAGIARARPQQPRNRPGGRGRGHGAVDTSPDAMHHPPAAPAPGPADDDEGEEPHSLGDKVTAVRAVLAGQPPPDWLTQEDLLVLARTLSSAENQHRMSKVRESGMGLTWDAALEVLRYALIAATDIFAPERGEDAVQRTGQLGNLIRAKVMEYNERLAREL